MLGYAADELIGRSSLELVRPVDREFCCANTKKLVAGTVAQISWRNSSSASPKVLYLQLELPRIVEMLRASLGVTEVGPAGADSGGSPDADVS